MLLLYLDEFGHSGAWDPADPKHSHHPLFGLAGIVVECAKARELDRGYFHLKETFYKHEIGVFYRRTGERAERFEAKQFQNRRDHRFAKEVIRLVRQLGGHVIAHGVAKSVGVRSHRQVALYHSVMQGVLRTFDEMIAHAGATSGIVILDRRSEQSDCELLASAQSYLFSDHERVGRVAETPLLVRSDWHHGVQAADTVGRVVGAVHRYRAAGEMRYAAEASALGSYLDGATLQLSSGKRSIYVKRKTLIQPRGKSAVGGQAPPPG